MILCLVKHYHYKNRMIDSTTWLSDIELKPEEKNAANEMHDPMQCNEML